MRSNRQRGASFNVGRRHPEQHLDSRGGRAVRGGYTPFQNTSFPGHDQHRAVTAYDTEDSRQYHDSHRPQTSSLQQKDNPSNLSRRRSEGPLSNAASANTSRQFQQQQQQQLLSMKSTPNLAEDDAEDKETPHEMKQLAKSSPDLLEDRDPKHAYPVGGMSVHAHVDTTQGMGYRSVGGRTYSSDMYTSDMSPVSKNVRRSLPAHALHRYQPDYENVSHLGMAPLQSEKISEIDDIDEVTGKESSPQTPETMEFDPLRGAGLPTRDPASLRYIKVNQNHEKYPSWPVTKPGGSSEQAQPINSRAQSMTDHTNTSTEFPKKQQLAYTPGLRPLPEKYSPASDDGKTRNGSDPGFKSEFVYDRFGRVHRRKLDRPDARFDDFYNNSKPGYPPPNMDSDGHNFGDKNYSAPSPPERDAKGISHHELSYLLGSVDSPGDLVGLPARISQGPESLTRVSQGSEPLMRVSQGSEPLMRVSQGSEPLTRVSQGSEPLTRVSQGPESHRASSQMNSFSESKARPVDLNLNKAYSPASQSLSKTESSTSPLDKGSPLSNLSPRDLGPAFLAESVGIPQNRHQSFHDKRQTSTQMTWQDKGSLSPHSSPSSQNHISYSIQAKASSPKGHAMPPGIHRDRSSSHHSFPTHSEIHGASISNSSAKKQYIVRSTPYYNTSTQTEMIPYAIKVSHAGSGSTRLKHAQIQVDEAAVQTSMEPQEQRKQFEEKWIQARMSRDFQNPEVELSIKEPITTSKKQNEELFKYQSTLMNASQPSPFKGIQSIQAKYATDELGNISTDSGHGRSLSSTYSDNASILRKLSEEFYGHRLGMMPDKRASSSSSQDSPRFDPPNTPQEPGMREAESCSSVVIHHGEKSGPFGRDDFGSMSSVTDPSLDTSLVLSESSFMFRSKDAITAARRRSHDITSHTQKARLYQLDQRLSHFSAMSGQKKDHSLPEAGRNLASARDMIPYSRGSDGKVHNVSKLSSDTSSVSLSSKSSSSDSRSSQNKALASSVSSPLFASSQISSASSSNTSPAIAQGNQVVVNNDSQRSARVGSDSVFIEDYDIEAEDLGDYEFNRKPSMRKAYGIYDETEQLISQTKISGKVLLDEGTKSSDGGAEPYAPSTRGNRYHETQGLGKIQEEMGTGVGGHDLDNTDAGRSKSGKLRKADEIMAGWKEEKQKYPWQNEAWLRNNVELSKTGNLKRATSEQISLHKHSVEGQKLPSHEASLVTDLSVAKPSSHSTSKPPSAVSSYLDTPVLHSRTKSEDLTHQVHQKQTSSAFTGYSNSPKSKDTSSLEAQFYESVPANINSDSISEVITQVNENLAKSARRVDSIRRSNSSSSRSSSDYMDMSRMERNRKETDWSRLRSAASSLRYSPDQERRSSRSSFASENPYEDISLFSPSTPRSSFAEGKDIVLQQSNSSSSMDSGLLSSPTYQNLPPLQRRPPPLPPRSQSPELAPPALPPRKYRENHQQMFNMEKPAPTSITQQNSTKSPVPAHNERIRVNVMPLGKQQNEENQVDCSKRDFRSLMTQWENSSPREDNYAAELRKQARKFSGSQQQQQQQISSIPAAYERTKPKISLATTFKHEPMQPQEATSVSPTSSSSSSTQAQSTTTAIKTHLSSSSTIPSASALTLSSPSSSISQPSAFINSTVSSLNQGAPTFSSSSQQQSTKPSPAHRNISAQSKPGHMAPSSIPANIPGKVTAEKISGMDEYRNRSSSDGVQAKPQAAGGSLHGSHGNRDRSSSDHDVLSDRNSQKQGPLGNVVQAGGGGGVSKWRPGRAGTEQQQQQPSARPQGKTGQLVEIVSMSPASRVSAEDAKGFDQSDDNDRFADESYIGHKNKSSRAIGTYKRSKSAAILQPGSGGDGGSGTVDDAEKSSAFQEQKLGQQSWSSESVLTRTDNIIGVPATGGGAEGHRVTGVDRFSRPGLHGRDSDGQLPVIPPASAALGNSPPSAHSTTSPGILTYKPFVKEQSAGGASQANQRLAASSTLTDPSFDVTHPSVRDTVHDLPKSAYGSREDAQRRHLDNSDSYLPQRWNNEDVNNIHAWSGHPSTFSPSSSQDIAANFGPSGYNSSSNNPVRTSQNDPVRSLQNTYQRRDSSPIKSTSSASSPISKLGSPPDDLGSISRRCSDSGISSTQRSDYSLHDVSTASHSRQPSQEELECDEKAMQLAQELEEKDHKLSEVLRLDANKKRMQYMNGLFAESMDEPNQLERSLSNQETRPSVRTRGGLHDDGDDSVDRQITKRGSLPKEYWMSSSKAMLEMELRRNEDASKELTKDINDSCTLMKHKEELMEKLHKKLVVLKEERVALQQEIQENNLLGKQVFLVTEAKCQSNSERDKFKTYIDDLEKIVRLLLNLSGQLARAQNAVQALGPDADAKLKKLTIDKRERLFAKHEEAKLLKEDIDKRSDQLTGMLRERLNEKEFTDYTHFVKMKSKLTIELQEMDDKITLGDEQISELKKSIPDATDT